MQYHACQPQWKKLVLEGLAEDGWPWDWTSLGTVSGGAVSGKPARARVIAKSTGIWAARGLVDTLPELAHELDARLKKSGFKAMSPLQDGAFFKQGQSLVELRGPAHLILALERTFLNLAAYASGIATQTQELVSRARIACPKNPPRVAHTRKILPFYRDLCVHAVRAGGGFPHRLNLSGGILIKENHVAAAGGIAKALRGARATAPHLLKAAIEVRNLRELSEALEAGAEAVLLDNFSPREVKSALERIRQSRRETIVEVSGGIHSENIAQYALPGVDVISTGSITHSVKACDFSLLFDGLLK